MIQRVRRPDGTNLDIDHGPGPFGDDDVRLIREARSPAVQQAYNVGQMVPNKEIHGLNVLRVQQGQRRRQRQRAGVQA